MTGELASGQSITLAPLSASTTGQYYVLPNGMAIPSGATLNIASSASVTIADQQFISVSGQLNITDSSVPIDKNAGCCSDGIVVNNGGKMTVTGSSFSLRRQQRL